MTFTDEQMTEYAEWAANSPTEPDFTPEPGTGVPSRYAHLTPTEQAEQVDEDWREQHAYEEAEEDRRLFWESNLRWW